jgi:predicted protein tyrosine phosphatase
MTPMRLDMTEIAPGLFQGSRPPAGPALARHGIDLLVLAAEEFQPPETHYPGVRVLYVPLQDTIEPSEQDRQAVRIAAREVARAVEGGQRVLVTCWAGLNRSGWIVAHALADLGYPVSRVLPMVRKRPFAMNNRSFAADVLTRRDERFVRRRS